MATPVAAIGSDSTLVEVEDAAGSKLTIRLGDTAPIDVSSVLARFEAKVAAVAADDPAHPADADSRCD